jgi:class 3 adenylate cyclase/tetratricopeptide (TPR) repeat protein
MRCPACDHDNPEVARYCADCGAHLTASCPHCDAPVSLGTRFCTTCGGAIPDAGTVEAGRESDLAAPPAERRRVSVLFVDLENFTALAESLDPEEVRTIQSRYFEVARSIVARYGGTIEKFIGDAVMAVWGAPVAHEDDAERAVRAAVALVHAVGRVGGAAAGTSLSARAAVTSGEAAVTVGAVGQGMIAGDLVNAAARLQAEAPLGGVLVDQATREQAGEAAGFEPVGSLALRGRSASLAAFRVSDAAVPPQGRRGGSHTGPFVGRERELRELVELFRGVAREGRSRLVSVTGIAGIGKSRLAFELHEQLGGIPDLVAWHAGRAPAYGDDVTFAAVAEMVRRRIRVDDVTEPQLAMRQLAGTLRELVRDPEERRWLEPRIAVLLGREAATAYDREELFAAWRRFFERVSDRAPAVLVFEDLQWADPSLLDFIEHLAAWSRDHPILIVALARPELMDRRPGWGVTLRSFTSLHLERLPDAAMRELLASRAADLPDTLVSQILEHAGGVPLYAVEVVRILADQGTAAAIPDRRATPRPAAAHRPSAIEVPDSLHGLIAARIDALPRPERRLLLAAGVLGRRFRPGALIAVAGGDPSVTRERIESLIRRELLAVDDDLRSPGHGEVGFVQDLVREVAYQTLSRSERRDLHLDAARYLGALDDENLAESLAGHLVQAHELAPDHRDAPRIARRAVAALRLAARDAIRLHVPERALGHLELALRRSGAAIERARLLEESADAARAAGRLELAEGHLRELVALHARSGRPEDVARARAQLASVLLIGQQNEPALVELETALRAIRNVGADASGIELVSQLARARMVMGDDRAGLEWAERALAGAQRLGLEATATDLLVTRGTARFRLGDEEAGLADLRRAIELSEAAGSLNIELRARNNLAWLVVADDPRTTMETARAGFELASAMGVRDMAVQLADVACAAALDTGDWDWALETAADLELRGVSAAFQIDLASISAVINALRGRPDPLAVTDGRDRDLDLDLDLSTIDPQVRAGVTYSRAWVAFVNGSFDEAATLATQAVADSLGAERARQAQLAVRANLWAGDREGAGDGIRTLDEAGVTGRATDAARATLEAGIAALDGDPTAHGRYRAAAQAWRELALPLPLALCLLDAERLGGGAPADPAECDRLLRSLGADGLARLAGGAGIEAVSPRPAPRPPARSTRPTASTASRSDGGHRRRRASDPPAPRG